jgi:signal transduction histidine kinase/CheY-like chemotaxis protein
MSFIRKYLMPPSFEDPRATERARVLHLMMMISLVMVLGAAPFASTEDGHALIWFPLLGGYVALQVGGLWAVRRGWAQRVGVIYCLSIYALLVAGQFVVSHSPALLAVSFVNIMIVAGLSVGSRAAVGFGILSVLTLGILAWTESTGQMPPPIMFGRTTDLIIQSTFPLAVSTAIIAYGLKRLNGALMAAEQSRCAQERRAREATSLADLGQRIVRMQSFDEYSNLVVRVISEVFEPSTIAFYRADAGSFRRSAHLGEMARETIELKQIAALSNGEGPDAWEGGCKVIDADTEGATAYLSEEFQGRVVLLRIGSPEAVRAVLVVATAETEELDEHRLDFLRTCAGLIEASMERTSVEEQLRHGQKMEAVGQLAGGIAHDFNNLLTGILGCASLAQETVSENDDLQPLLSDIVRAGDHAALLTRQLLAFSRKDTLTPEILDIRRVIGDLRGILGRLIGENLQLRMPDEGPPAWVEADRNALEQILLNLCLNARDAIEGTGEIEISVDTQVVDHVAIVVEDDGCGMDVETRSRIFEPFFTTKQDAHGTGLGLATVYRIVRQLGGEVLVASTPGEGARFEVRFPTSHAPSAEAGDLSERPPGAREGEIIVLVEDHDLARRSLRATLERAGYTVITARDGVEGLDRVDASPHVNAVLSDMVMPRMGGREFRDQLQARGHRFPIVLMSGYVELAAGRDPVDADDLAILQKPVPAPQLLRRLRAEIDRASAPPSSAGTPSDSDRQSAAS